LATCATAINTAMTAASKSFGKQLTWINNDQEIYDKMKAANKSEDYLWALGDPLKAYAVQFNTAMTEFCKNEDNKQQLETELSTGKIGLKFAPEDQTNDKYWVLEEGCLYMETKVGYFGSWLSYFDSERLCGILGSADPMPLNTRKNLKLANVQMTKDLAAVSKLFGKELSWVDNHQDLFDKLKAAGKANDYLWTMGNVLKQYTAQLLIAFTAFCKDKDNKEALEEVLTAGKVGVRIPAEGGDDKYWVIEDGTLWMESKIGYFGSWLSYFDADRLEKKL